MSNVRASTWLTCLDLALVVALVALGLAWFFDPFRWVMEPVRFRISWGLKPILAPVLLVALRIWFARSRGLIGPPGSPQRRLPKLALALFMTGLPLVLLEGVLARAGVPEGEPVFVVRGQGGQATRADGSMVKDADLLWRFEPGKVFNGRTVNALGFLDREVSATKSPGVTRVICLGDSCSAQGSPPYSGHLHNLLQEKSPDGRPWESFNAAVHGYTVLQGLALFRKRIAALAPDIVTIYYGWNDHWLAERDDPERLARAGSAWVTAVRNALVRKRLVQVVARKNIPEKPALKLRVSPEAYSEGLTTLIREIQAAGARPLVLTAPRGRTVHGHIANAGHARSVEDANRLHDEYAELTRRAARATDARLLDLAAVITNKDLISSDGIHFNTEGRKEVARLIYADLTAWANPPPTRRRPDPEASGR
jgi:lysophospholipase L1-like esterase